jgi:hypothetical protein
MKTTRRILVVTMACLSLFAITASAQPLHALTSEASLMTSAIEEAELSSDPELDCDHTTYTTTCLVIRLGNGGGCIYNVWRQTHHVQSGPDCVECFESVDPNEDVQLSHYVTQGEPCNPYNDCVSGTTPLVCPQY